MEVNVLLDGWNGELDYISVVVPDDMEDGSTAPFSSFFLEYMES